MYGEDIDISYSAELAGYTNYYKGDITVLHYKGESTKRDKKYFKIFFEAMMIFLAKYYKDNWLNYQVLRAGIAVKYCVEMIKFNLSNQSNQQKVEVNKNELNWINQLSELKNQQNQNIVLDTERFSYQEILSIISQYNSSNTSFYIHPKNKNYVIGDDKKVIRI